MIYKCYDLRLGSDCNLGKDLSKDERNNQLVKCKDTKLYLQLYIPIDHKEYIRCSLGNNKERMRKI